MRLNKTSIIQLLIFAFLFTTAIPGEAQRRTKTVKRAGAKRVYKTNHRRTVNVRTYRTLPRFRARVSVVPAGARIIAWRGIKYRFHDGIFYRPAGKAFIVARPAIGIRVRTLPAARYRLRWAGRNYFYYYGVFYAVQGDEYEVIEAPVGAQVDTLPEGYETIEKDGIELYQVGETTYKPIENDEGETMFEVVES